MKIVLTHTESGRASYTIALGRWARALLSLCCLGLPVGLMGLGYLLAQLGTERNMSLEGLQDEVEAQGRAVADVRAQTERRLRSLSKMVAEMEARLLRLDALGERLTGVAGMDDGEFDFSRPPALGGPLDADAPPLGSEAELSAFAIELTELDALITDREQQIELLQVLLANRQTLRETSVAGRPVTKGWVSSGFGRRKDPFTGQTSWHQGVDFNGPEGADIMAVAGGVVVWAGSDDGYGEMVEISHGGGFSTRYAHNKENLVKVGDVVKKGQLIARMGSSGRSTGPHVHYEVFKHGRPVDPSVYLRRNIP